MSFFLDDTVFELLFIWELLMTFFKILFESVNSVSDTTEALLTHTKKHCKY